MTDFAELADRGWPGLETVAVQGWVARFAGGVTKRANSVWPRSEAVDAAAAVAEVESLYRQRGIRPAFQLTRSQAQLEALLKGRGYEAVDETLVMSARVEGYGAGLGPGLGAEFDGALRITDAPDEEWLGLWWAVDGRGGRDEREVARRIMTAGPALYAEVRDAYGPACVGRLALVDGWGGLYAIATRVDARRRGHARALVAGLAEAALERGISGLWLQVLAGNSAAVGLYRSLGFSTVGGYRYLVAPDAAPPSAGPRAANVTR